MIICRILERNPICTPLLEAAPNQPLSDLSQLPNSLNQSVSGYVITIGSLSQSLSGLSQPLAGLSWPLGGLSEPLGGFSLLLVA